MQWSYISFALNHQNAHDTVWIHWGPSRDELTMLSIPDVHVYGHQQYSVEACLLLWLIHDEEGEQRIISQALWYVEIKNGLLKKLIYHT